MNPLGFSKPQNCMVPVSATVILNFSAKIQKNLHKATERWADQGAPRGADNWQTVATPGIYKDNNNCQKLTATHRRPPSKHQTVETTFDP